LLTRQAAGIAGLWSGGSRRLQLRLLEKTLRLEARQVLAKRRLGGGTERLRAAIGPQSCG